MDKPEITPLGPEERDAIERVGAEVDEKMETPSARTAADVNRESIARREASDPLRNPLDVRLERIEVALADIERLAVLAYTGVTILLDRFGVTDEQFAETVKATVDFLRRRNAPDAPAAPEPKPAERSAAKGDTK